MVDTATGTNAGGKAPSKLAMLMDAPLQATGADIPEGSYGATLYGFSEPTEMDATKSKFYKQGDPPKKVMFEAYFGLYDKNGVPARVEYFLPVPDGGVTNRKSNVYKMLKSLATGTPLIAADGSFAKGTTLKSFMGLNAVLAVKKNDKDFPNVASVGPKMDGVKYPTLEECQKIVVEPEASDNIPF